MTIKTILANGNIEIYENNDYVLGKSKNFHPMILKVRVYSNAGKKLASRSRKFSFFYKHFTFKSEKVQNEIKRLNELNSQKIMENSVEVKE